MTLSDVLHEVMRQIRPCSSVTIERGGASFREEIRRVGHACGYGEMHQMRVATSTEPGLEGPVACEVRSWSGVCWTSWRQISPPRFELVDVLAADWRIV